MITVEDLSFTYAGASAPALRGLSFAIARGEIVGFLGPSGAGKSTTQNILIGLLKGYQGSISALGRDLKAWGADYYERVGVAFELPNHFRKLTAQREPELLPRALPPPYTRAPRGARSGGPRRRRRLPRSLRSRWPRRC